MHYPFQPFRQKRAKLLTELNQKRKQRMTLGHHQKLHSNSIKISMPTEPDSLPSEPVTGVFVTVKKESPDVSFEEISVSVVPDTANEIKLIESAQNSSRKQRKNRSFVVAPFT